MRPGPDRLVLAVLIGACLVFAGRDWLVAHPQYDPDAPLRLSDPPGWATARKLVALREDPQACRAFLTHSDIAFGQLPVTGQGQCRREDRMVLASDPALGLVLRPAAPQATCAVGAGLVLWLARGVQPAARRHLGTQVTALVHYGTNSCRRINTGKGTAAGEGSWSEHATGNAIDIAGFVLADGHTLSVRRDWRDAGARGRFLHEARDAACGTFGTVLSPDYNAAHADHLHLDQAGSRRGWSFCR